MHILGGWVKKKKKDGRWLKWGGQRVNTTFGYMSAKSRDISDVKT